jgi:hypothetical protein
MRLVAWSKNSCGLTVVVFEQFAKALLTLVDPNHVR